MLYENLTIEELNNMAARYRRAIEILSGNYEDPTQARAGAAAINVFAEQLDAIEHYCLERERQKLN